MCVSFHNLQWSYEELLKYVEQRTATVEELSKHFGRLADIYEDMGKAQSKLLQRWYTGVPALIDGELGSTAASALNGVVTAEGAAEACYRAFAGGVQQRVVRLLDDFAASAAALQRRLQADYQHLWKQYVEVSAGVAKSRARYARAWAARERRDAGGAVEAAEQQYRQGVASCNRMQAALFQHTLGGCHVLDDLLQRRDRVLESSLRTVAALAETVLPREAVAALLRSADSIATGADIDLFAATCELSSDPPHCVFFESCSSTGVSSSSSSAATSTTMGNNFGSNGNCTTSGATNGNSTNSTNTSSILPPDWKPTEISLLRMPLEGLVVMQQMFGRSGPRGLPYGLKWLLETLVDACAHEPAATACDVSLQTVPPAELTSLMEAFARGDYATPKSAAAACALVKVFLCSLPESLVPPALTVCVAQDAPAPRDTLTALAEPHRSTLGCCLAALQTIAHTPGNSAASVADGFALCCVRTPQLRRDVPALRRTALAARRWFVRLLTELDYTPYLQYLADGPDALPPCPSSLPALAPSLPAPLPHAAPAASTAGSPPRAWTKSAPSKQRTEAGDAPLGAGCRGAAEKAVTESAPAQPPPPLPPRRPPTQPPPHVPSRAPPPPPPATRPRGALSLSVE